MDWVFTPKIPVFSKDTGAKCCYFEDALIWQTDPNREGEEDRGAVYYRKSSAYSCISRGWSKANLSQPYKRLNPD